MSAKINLNTLKQHASKAWQTKSSERIGIGRATAAIFGALILSLAINIAMSVFLPMPVNNRLALASILMIPIWVALSFYCLLMRNGLVAWATTTLSAGILLIAVFLWGF